jgi:hypothetical protein
MKADVILEKLQPEIDPKLLKPLALQRLLVDIADQKVDVVVVYKIDRLTQRARKLATRWLLAVRGQPVSPCKFGKCREIPPDSREAATTNSISLWPPRSTHRAFWRRSCALDDRA